MKDLDKIDWFTIGMIVASLIVAVVITIAQLTMPTKRQSYRVYKENELTIVEKVEE